jgi:hypothetical protein
MDRHTDRHDEPNCRLPHFCDAPKNGRSPKQSWLEGMRCKWHKSTVSFGMTIDAIIRTSPCLSGPIIKIIMIHSLGNPERLQFTARCFGQPHDGYRKQVGTMIARSALVMVKCVTAPVDKTPLNCIALHTVGVWIWRHYRNIICKFSGSPSSKSINGSSHLSCTNSNFTFKPTYLHTYVRTYWHTDRHKHIILARGAYQTREHMAYT